MKVGERIRAWRTEKGYTTEALGKRLGISRQTVYRYESGMITNIPRDKIERMAELFGVSPMAFFGDGEEVLSLKDVFPMRSRAVPMLGEIACGEPIYADEEKGRYALVGDDVEADFCLRARGDSMTGARIYDGDIVFVAACEMVENGEIGVVIVEDEATLKRVYYYPEKQKLILTPENPAYEPLVYFGEELETIKIIGKAVAFQSRL